jgi:hypothetical protein
MANKAERIIVWRHAANSSLSSLTIGIGHRIEAGRQNERVSAITLFYPGNIDRFIYPGKI